MTVSQNEKNINKIKNVKRGCKNSAGTAAKHRLVSSNNSAKTSTRLHIANINNNKIIWKQKINLSISYTEWGKKDRYHLYLQNYGV